MSGHHVRPGLRPRRSTYSVIAAAAAIFVLAVTACSSATTSTSAAAVAATSIGPGGHAQLARTMLQQVTGPTGTQILS